MSSINHNRNYIKQKLEFDVKKGMEVAIMSHLLIMIKRIFFFFNWVHKYETFFDVLMAFQPAAMGNGQIGYEYCS